MPRSAGRRAAASPKPTAMVAEHAARYKPSDLDAHRSPASLLPPPSAVIPASLGPSSPWLGPRPEPSSMTKVTAPSQPCR